MRFDSGFISPYFVADLKTQKLEFEKPFFLLSEKISLLQEYFPRPRSTLDPAAPARRSLLTLSQNVDGEALAACTPNDLPGQFQVTAVKAPGLAKRQSIFGDLAVLTGGIVFTDKPEVKPERATAQLLGCHEFITRDNTIVLDGDVAKGPKLAANKPAPELPTPPPPNPTTPCLWGGKFAEVSEACVADTPEKNNAAPGWEDGKNRWYLLEGFT